MTQEQRPNLHKHLAISNSVYESFSSLKKASRILRHLETSRKNEALKVLAGRILASMDNLMKANREDLDRLPEDATSAFRDRLTLTPLRIEGMVESLRQVAVLPDPVGNVVEEKSLPNGLKLRRVLSPLGVIFMIFESRPNVILEAFSLAFKSGNAIALRGGSDSSSTARTIYTIMREALSDSGIDPNVFIGMNDYNRSLVEELLKRKDLIDVVVPRGGERLIEFVQKTAMMPIIKNDRGLCHAYVDNETDIAMATKIIINAKTQRPGVCNSLETLLVNSEIASAFLPHLYENTLPFNLKWRVDTVAFEMLKNRKHVSLANSEDWDTEYLDLILNCRVVKNIEEAIDHIENHGSRHSETIITTSESKARRFQAEVDSAAVYWNASTRFTDGFEFGLGGELGISTQKLHVRGPVGLRELTTARWIIDGTGQVRI